MKRFLLFALVYATPLTICIPTELSFTPPFTITGSATQTAFFLCDSDDNEFVLKYHPRGIKRAIHDALGAYIGKSIGIHINAVEVFSPHDPFTAQFQHINPLPPSQFGVITLHSRVPGIQVKHIKHLNEEIYIKRGLCKKQHLQNITHYMQLCDIDALDIFTDNTDRHNRNIFFDAATDSFYAIDMDHSFKSAFALIDIPHEYEFDTLATRAYDFLKTVKKGKLSKQEIKALKQVKQTLQKLAQLYPPAALFDEWMAVAHKADYIYKPREQRKIRKYLEHNARQVERLIELLGEIIA